MNRQDVALDDFIRRSESRAVIAAETLALDDARVTAFIEFNIPINQLSPVGNRSDLVDLVQWLQQPRRFPGTGVLLDNTTIVTLTTLLAGADRLSPLTLWDLGRAIMALITYDNVFHFANSEVNDDTLNAALGQDVFHALSLPHTGPDYDPSGVRGLFNQAWASTENVMQRLEASVGTDTMEGLEIEALISQWSLALGRTLTPGDVIDTQLSNYEWNSPGSAFLAQLWRTTRTYAIQDSFLPAGWLDELGNAPIALIRRLGMEDDLGKVIREGNLRGHVNQRLAGHLKLPYAPNMARIPFRSRFYDRALAISDRLPSILALDEQYAERVTNAQLLPREPFVLPVFLAVALRNAAVPQDLWAAVAALRAQARRYRERRVDLDQALEQGDLDVTAAALKALRTDAAKLTELLVEAGKASGGEIVSDLQAKPIALLSGMPLDWLESGLSALIAGARKLVPKSVTDRLMWRLCRPELRFLSDIASQSRAISHSMPAVKRLWGLPERQIDNFQRRYESFAELQNLERFFRMCEIN
jgi:hypothetical protein